MIMSIGKALHKRTKGEKGFTLIELIVVIAVLGLLAVLIIPRVIGVRGQAEESVGKVNEKIIRNALERYYVEHDKYPTGDSTTKILKALYDDKLLSESDFEGWEVEIEISENKEPEITVTKNKE